MSHDLILVRFKAKPRGLFGKTVLDPLGRSKIVFLENHNPWSWESGSFVQSGELWRCYVVQETKPEDRRRGALIVEPLARIGSDLWEACLKTRSPHASKNGVLTKFARGGYHDLVLDPELAPVALTAIDKMLLPNNGRKSPVQVRQIELDWLIGYRQVLPAPLIGYSEKTAFAYLDEAGPPVRVLHAEPQPTNILAMKLRRRRVRKKSKSALIWYIVQIAPHSLPLPMPHEALDPSFWSVCKHFWCQHAYAYNPVRMSPIILSSLEEISGALPKQADAQPISLTLH